MGGLLGKEANLTQAGGVFETRLEMGSGSNTSVLVEASVEQTNHRLHHCFGRIQTGECEMTDEDWVILGVLSAGLLLAVLVGCWACSLPPPQRVVKVVERRPPPPQQPAVVMPQPYAPYPPPPSQYPQLQRQQGTTIVVTPGGNAAEPFETPEKQPLLRVSVEGLLSQ